MGIWAVSASCLISPGTDLPQAIFLGAIRVLQPALAEVICTHGFCPLSSLPHPRLHLPTSSLWLAVPRSSLLAQAFSSVKITAAFNSSSILVQVFQYAFQSYHLFPSGGSHGRYTVQVFRLHHKYRSDADVDYKGLIWFSSASHQYLLLVALGESDSHFLLPHGNIAAWEAHTCFRL